MISTDLLNQIDNAYAKLEAKMNEVYNALRREAFELERGWYNDHYSRGTDGGWIRQAYPIPVVTIRGLCDIEVSFEGVTLTTKLSREQALEYPYERLADYDFEAYGVEDYLSDFYSKGKTLSQLRENISGSTEKEIFFTFALPSAESCEYLCSFAKLLKREGFYY